MENNIIKILSKVDHTMLAPDAKWEDIKALCDDAIKYQTASVCIPPSYVRRVKATYGNLLPICTVIGFPNGYSTTEVKLAETKDAISNGADEIDMVINIGWLKDGNIKDLSREIFLIKEACGPRILKVIIETCLLTDEEKITMCNILSHQKANFIKTSTGFSTAGATFDDVKLFKEHIANHTKIKAAGGIKTLDDAQKFIDLGADRLGTSKVVKIVKKMEKEMFSSSD